MLYRHNRVLDNMMLSRLYRYIIKYDVVLPNQSYPKLLTRPIQ